MRRVVVTGLGAISPCGHDVATNWDALVHGRSGIGPITRFDVSDWAVRIAGEVKDWKPEALLHRRDIKRLDRFAQFAVVAADEAIADAGLSDSVPLGDRVGVYVGSGIGGIQEFFDGSMAIRDVGPKGLTPFFIPKVLTNLAGGHVAMRLGARGPSLCVSTACATGNHSIGEAFRAIRYDEADVVVAGGAEAAIVPLGMAGFMVMRALSKRNDDPAQASRPFDRDRDGFVMGEGAGILVLEELEHAKQRGATIYAEIVGYGLTNDAFHITAPSPSGEGATRCMSRALQSGEVNTDEVDYVNAHGTSTPANDPMETQAIKTVFGEHAYRLAVSSTKSMTGHLLGAAGGIEAIATIKALDTGVIPPTATLREPGDDCDLDYVPGQAREAPIQTAITNSFGFGGTNATLVFRRFSS